MPNTRWPLISVELNACEIVTLQSPEAFPQTKALKKKLENAWRAYEVKRTTTRAYKAMATAIENFLAQH